MKKYLLSLICFLFFIPVLNAQKDSVMVGPGVMYYSERRAAGPYEFDILVIDLKNPYIKLQSVKAQDRLKAFERTSSMAARHSYEGHLVIGAVNGDFYNTGTGEPISTQIINGEILRNANDRLNIAWDEAKKTLISVVNSSGIIVKGDSVIPINNFNASRTDNTLILYNSYMGASTLTNAFGTEVLVTPINDWQINDTVICVVDNKITTGNMSIPAGKAVLSGHGIAAEFLNNNLNTGDTVKIFVSVEPGLKGLNQLVGGNPIIVRNGVPQGDNVDKHPRTAIGVNEDSTKLYLITVDGRQAGYSVGMTLLELGQYMTEWGVYQGLNLDGGGSTTMVVRGKVMNSPSDGSERTVSNGLLLISTAPTGPLHHVRVTPRIAYSAPGTTAQFTVTGYDEHYNPVSLSGSTIQWSCTPAAGTIDATGLFTASDDTTSGVITVTVDGLTDSVQILKSKITSILLTPNPVILQPGQQQQMKATAKDNYNNTIPLSNTDYTWSVTGGVGDINASGFFTGTTFGEGTIEAKYEDVTGSVPVQVGNATYFVVDDFTTTSNYTITGAAANLSLCSFLPDQNVFVSPPSSGRLAYSYTVDGTSAVYLNRDLPISGTPEKVSISVYGDGKGHWLRGEFKDADGERFLLNFTEATPGVDWSNEWRFVEQPFTKAVPSWANPNAILTYPVTWMRLYLVETNAEKKGNGAINLDDFKVHFIAVPQDANDESAIPDKFDLKQNYPNPFNPNTVIKYSIPSQSMVSLKIHDVLGKELAVLVNEFQKAGNYEYNYNANNLPAGVYFYTLNASGSSRTNKMVLLK